MFTKEIKDCIDTLDMLYQTKEFIGCDRPDGLNIAMVTVELVSCCIVILNGKEKIGTQSSFRSIVWCTYENKSSLTCACLGGSPDRTRRYP